MMLLVNTTIKQEVPFWIVALCLHMFLLLLRFDFFYQQSFPLKNAVPIVEIEFISVKESVVTSLPEKKAVKEGNFFSNIKKLFQKKQEEAPSGLSDKISNDIKKEIDISNNTITKLVDKKFIGAKIPLPTVSLPKKEILSGETGEIKSIDVGKENITSGSSGGTLKDTKYVFAKKDLPFEVLSKRDSVSSSMDSVSLAVSEKTSKNVYVNDSGLKNKEFSGTNYKQFTPSFAPKSYTSNKIGDSNLSQPEVFSDNNINTIQIGSSGEQTDNSSQSSLGSANSGNARKSDNEKSGGVGRYNYSKSAIPLSSVQSKTNSSSVESKTENKSEQNATIYTVSGQIKNRRILYKVLPSYPDWLEKQGIEVSVAIHFVVDWSGKVLDNLYVEKTSGIPQLDKLAMKNLMDWKFEPLSKEKVGVEEWGIITFYFSLR